MSVNSVPLSHLRRFPGTPDCSLNQKMFSAVEQEHEILGGADVDGYWEKEEQLQRLQSKIDKFITQDMMSHVLPKHHRILMTAPVLRKAMTSASLSVSESRCERPTHAHTSPRSRNPQRGENSDSCASSSWSVLVTSLLCDLTCPLLLHSCPQFAAREESLQSAVFKSVRL